LGAIALNFLTLKQFIRFRSLRIYYVSGVRILNDLKRFEV